MLMNILDFGRITGSQLELSEVSRVVGTISLIDALPVIGINFCLTCFNH